LNKDITQSYPLSKGFTGASEGKSCRSQALVLQRHYKGGNKYNLPLG